MASSSPLVQAAVSPAASPEGCCPPGAELWSAPPEGYQSKGRQVLVGELQCYVVGVEGGSPGVVMFSDIFGPDAGRHLQLCDQLASEGFLVVCPNLFLSGSPVGRPPSTGVSCAMICKLVCFMLTGKFKAFCRTHSWDAKLQRDVLDAIVPYMEEHGARRFAAVGFCWGSYGAMKCAAFPDKFACCVSFHPSTEQVCQSTGEDDMQICREMRCPQMVVSTATESAKWRPGGLAQEVVECVAHGCVFESAPAEVKHGYMTRADLTVPANHAAVQRGMASMTNFLRKHLVAQR